VVHLGWVGKARRSASPCRPARWWGALLLVALSFTSARADEAGPQPDPATRSDLARARNGVFAPTPEGLRAEVARIEALGQRLHAAATTVGSAPASNAVALQTRALGSGLTACQGLVFQPVFVDALPDGGAAGPTRVLYLLASHPTEPMVVSGIHYRLGIAADGASFDTIEPSTNACTAVKGTSSSVYVFSHVRDCAPNEFHVYLSMRHDKPLLVATSVGRWWVDQGRIQLVSTRPQLCADRPVTTLLDRWVALGNGGAPDGKHQIGMPYMDWEAGLTIEAVGEAQRDAEGRFHWIRRVGPDAPSVKVRLSDHGQLRNPRAAALSAQAVRELELEDPPPWLGAYARRGDPQDTAIALGAYLNHLGDPAGAVHHLAPLSTVEPDRSRRRAYELGFAFNALHRHDSALRVLMPAAAGAPTDPDLCREIAFAHANLGESLQAARQYSQCFRLAPESAVGYRMEIARQQVVLARALGAPDRCREWLQILRVEMSRVGPGDPGESLANRFRGLTCDP
jgi:hypothetical protein